jgi:hypothetical protein
MTKKNITITGILLLILAIGIGIGISIGIARSNKALTSLPALQTPVLALEGNLVARVGLLHNLGLNAVRSDSSLGLVGAHSLPANGGLQTLEVLDNNRDTLSLVKLAV